jgi:hypothetical protein
VRVAIFLDRLSRLYDGADSGDLVFRMRDGSAVTTLIDQFAYSDANQPAIPIHSSR